MSTPLTRQLAREGELHERIAELESKLAELVLENSDLAVENLRLEAKLEKLRVLGVLYRECPINALDLPESWKRLVDILQEIDG